MGKVTEARLFAIEAHKDTKYGDLPYEYHLDAVHRIIGHSTPELQMAAYLHDVVEDTEATLHDIREKFGGRVAKLVDSVTDGEGKNRKEKKAFMYKKLASGGAAARRLKLADRIANMEASIEGPLAKMYLKEFPEFIRKVGIDTSNNDLILRLFWLYLNSQEANNG